MPVYISEVSYAGSTTDFVEIAAPAGTDLSSYSIYVHKSNGDITEGPLSLGSMVSINVGQDVYLVDDSTPGFAAVDAGDAIALVDDLGNVVQFISFEGNLVTATAGPADGQTSTASAPPATSTACSPKMAAVVTLSRLSRMPAPSRAMPPAR